MTFTYNMGSHLLMLPVAGHIHNRHSLTNRFRVICFMPIGQYCCPWLTALLIIV
jgi:hypothetical protein